MGQAKILAVDDEPDFEALPKQRFRRQIRSGDYAFRGLVTLLNKVRKEAAGGKFSSDRRPPSIHCRGSEASVRRG